MDEYLDGLQADMDKAVEGLRRDLSTVRTGRATPQLLDGIQVNVASYGANMPLNQLATVQAPDPRLLVVNPWDKSTMGDIERAISAAGLGLNPGNDGTVIRVPIPALTGERRQDLVRQVKKHLEEARVRVRHVRRDYNELLKELEKDSEITEDQLKRGLEQVQKATDDSITRTEAMADQKEQEVMEV